jgi:Protein of Unknown function (DUF2784)
MYLWLARLIVIVHALVVFILIFGGGTLIAGRFSQLHLTWRLLFVAIFISFIISEIVLHDCILTQLEKQLWLRYRTGAAYEGSFIDNYFPLLGRIIAQYGGWIIVAGILLRATYVWWSQTAKAHKPV